MPVLLLVCPDRPGLVASTAGFIADRGGNVIDADQHADQPHGVFLQRISFDLAGNDTVDDWSQAFAPIATGFAMEWALHRTEERFRTAVLVSRDGHCLGDLLARVDNDELPLDIAAVISNHRDHAPTTSRFGIDFHHLPVDPADRTTQPRELADLLVSLEVDLIILARYMQILPDWLVDQHPNRIINIHHSFLPAFAGANPYERAHSRGVKLIGATAHYVTAELDAGPIISQEVTQVSHRDDVARLMQRGSDLERLVLARAVLLHTQHRVIAYANRTVVFD